jgi:uncharacterized protein (DUF2164 family)
MATVFIQNIITLKHKLMLQLNSEQKKEAIDQIIYFFEEERDEKIGVIAAEAILNFFLGNVGKDIYNKGVKDARKILSQRMEEVHFDLDDLIVF